MDTDTIVAAMRSPTGASASLLRAARSGRVTLSATVPLCLEYEDVCSRPEHVAAVGFTPGDLAAFLDALADLVEPADVWFLWRPQLRDPGDFLWRPQLRDPGDELVLEAAVSGQAAAIVTFNRRDFRPAADRLDLEILLPAEAIRRVV